MSSSQVTRGVHHPEMLPTIAHNQYNQDWHNVTETTVSYNFSCLIYILISKKFLMFSGLLDA